MPIAGRFFVFRNHYQLIPMSTGVHRGCINNSMKKNLVVQIYFPMLPRFLGLFNLVSNLFTAKWFSFSF